jgi:hypothetical protein
MTIIIHGWVVTQSTESPLFSGAAFLFPGVRG